MFDPLKYAVSNIAQFLVLFDGPITVPACLRNAQ